MKKLLRSNVLSPGNLMWLLVLAAVAGALVGYYFGYDNGWENALSSQ